MLLRAIFFIISSIVGCGIFVAPSAILNFSGICGFIFTSILFCSIGYIFTKDNISIFSLVVENTNKKFGLFFYGFYWILGCATNIVLINEVLIYLFNSWIILKPYGLLIKIFLLNTIIIMNSFGIQNSSLIEMLITFLKVIPLTILPILFLAKAPIVPIDTQINSNNILSAIASSAWCFFGIENAATVGREITSKIKKATIISMIIVSLLYFLNIFSVLNYFNYKNISITSYSHIIFNLWGITGRNIFNIMVAIMCFGTLNAWTFSNSLIAVDAAKNNIFSKVFLIKNRYDSYYVSLILSNVLLFFLIFITEFGDISKLLLLCLDFFALGIFIIYIILLWALFKKFKNKISVICALLLTIIFFFNIKKYF
jgi:amino acid transporter